MTPAFLVMRGESPMTYTRKSIVSQLIVLVAVLTLTGCACRFEGGMTALGVATSIVTQDPTHAINMGIETGACIAGESLKP